MDETRKARIRAFNDGLRQTGQGGTVLCTSGIQALGEVMVREAIQALMRFDDFSNDNDPYGEHDFGSIELAGRTIFWKIDYYDLDLNGGSPDPADVAVTSRVLTIMLAEEY